MRVLKTSLIITSIAIFLSGCSALKKEDPMTGEEQFNDTAKMGALGVTSGAAIGALGGGVGVAVGAAVGGAVGGYYGSTLDEAKEELVQELFEFGIDVQEINGAIYVTIQNSLLFDVGHDKITEDSIVILEKFYSIVDKIDDKVFIKIIGHTDNSGELDYNISLSEQRARNVAYYLFDKGIKANRIDYKGLAHLKPVASNDTEEGRLKNRRVQIQIIPENIEY